MTRPGREGEDVVERVARAMYVAHARWAEPYLSEAWPPEAEETRDLYLTLARAALEAVGATVPHLEQCLDPLTQRREGRHVYVVDQHVNAEGPSECRRIGGRCTLRPAPEGEGT